MKFAAKKFKVGPAGPYFVRLVRKLELHNGRHKG